MEEVKQLDSTYFKVGDIVVVTKTWAGSTIKVGHIDCIEKIKYDDNIPFCLKEVGWEKNIRKADIKERQIWFNKDYVHSKIFKYHKYGSYRDLYIDELNKYIMQGAPRETATFNNTRKHKAIPLLEIKRRGK